MKPIDPLQLQRLVDGELDIQQVQQLLRDAEQTPEQWQEIATGFVENQIWNRAFQSTSKPEPETNPVLKNELGAVTSSMKQPPHDQTSVNRTGNSNFSWWVIAASLLAAVSIGYMASEIQGRNLPSSLTENHSVGPIDTAPELEIAKNLDQPNLDQLNLNQPNDLQGSDQPKMTHANYHLEVPENDKQFGQLTNGSTTVPLFTVSNREELNQLRQRRDKPVIPPHILKRLAGSGYQMKEDVKFISGKLGDGRSFVVPVRTIRFIPGQ